MIRRRLLPRFLGIVIPVFVLLSGSGLWLLSRYDLETERNQLAARVGNLAARTAIALSRYDPIAQPELAQDLLAPLAADRAIVCVELRAGHGQVLNRLPPAQGCVPAPAGEPFDLTVAENGSLVLHLVFTEAEITELTALRRNAALLAVLFSFAVALVAATFAYRLIIGQPLKQLLAAIRHQTETGERRPIVQRSADELGQVIAAFNEMQRLDAERESQLALVRDELSVLNLHLEQRVAARTKELRESEAGLRQLLERFPTSVYVQIEGRIVFANAAVVAQCGAGSVGKLLGKPSANLFHPSCRPQILEHHAHLRELGEALAFNDFTGMREDGTTFDAEGMATPVCWEGQRAILVVVLDVTERKQHEQALNAAKERAESANRAKSDFLATISHELRTPMAGVLGMARLLLGGTLSSEQRHQAERIQQSGEALLTLLNDILDISKIESGRLELTSGVFAPRRVLESVTALLESSARHKGLDFTVKMPDGMPSAVVGDAARIRQVLFNLVGNAVKFTERGGIVIMCEHRVLEPASDVAEELLELRFTITDSGIGIAKEAQDRIFERFVQADGSTNRKYGGTGLGLAICRELVAMMGGEIGLDSAPGKGSSFWISLPCRRGGRLEVAFADPLNPRRDWRAPPLPTVGPPLHILLAEDNPINQEIAAATLRQAGHKVAIVSDGAAAVAALQAERYDVVLMDVHMPEVDGLEATRRIRALPGPAAEVPIIALTADTMVGDREKILSAGLDDYVAKPFDLQLLFAAIARCLAPPSKRKRA